MGFLLQHSIDESAGRDPDHAAFRFGSSTLTYQQLVERSNRLACVLIEQGVRPHDRVGIYMTKGLDLPVAVYGILKAGAAYVPIDPAAPIARIAFIVLDCGLRHVVTTGERAGRLVQVAAAAPTLECVIGAAAPVPEGGRPLRRRNVGAALVAALPGPTLGTVRFVPWDAVEQAPVRHPDVRLVSGDLAYIMYTSGSTGAPKGLMHTHGSGLSYATLSAREYGVRADDRLGNHSPLHFDMSTFEYLTGPLCGATTVIISEEATMFPRTLAQLIERERLTFWYSVPLALIQLLERGAIEECDHRSLRWVLFGGEPFPPKHLARLATLWPDARFSNSYGPAEVNQCMAYHVPAGPIDPDAPIPIGRVWPGAESLIVDEHDAPVAAGEAGELLIRSETMMRGYWSRPDLNRQAFFRQPLFTDFDKVFYRTGDLVRQERDGTLVFLGRRDRQIKIRGYRVELEEVEAVMNALPGVREAAAVAVHDSDGQATIVAAVLIDDDAAGDAESLQRGAARRLPAYAVPSRIDIRQGLPRTGSDKIDRTVLAAEYQSAPD